VGCKVKRFPFEGFRHKPLPELRRRRPSCLS